MKTKNGIESKRFRYKKEERYYDPQDPNQFQKRYVDKKEHRI